MNTTLEAQHRSNLAIDHYAGDAPRILFCPGFKSNRAGSKAQFLKHRAEERRWAFTCFDYQGHGDSPGQFTDGTIGCWMQDTLAVIDATEEPLIIVGSSMGGWIALLAALQRQKRIAGLLLLACATDFTEALATQHLSGQQQQILNNEGVVFLPSDYDDGEPYAITRELIKEGQNHCLLDKHTIDIACPIRMIHGTADPDVPWQTSANTLEKLSRADARLLLLGGADHRLSDKQSLSLMGEELDALRRSVTN